MRLKLGTRGSDLALAQSGWVARALDARGVAVELEIISTSGDRSQAPSFGSIGPQGVFVREIEQALLGGKVDVAVHSFKDLPTTSPDELGVVAVPERVDPADYLVVHADAYRPTVDDDPLPLAPGSRVGTSSARRQAWLRHARDDLHIAPLRGNVPTRIKRVANRDYDAIVIAHAGIDRLEQAGDVLAEPMRNLRLVRLDPARFVPAPAQGALALQCRRADADIADALAALDDAPSRQAVDIERRVLARAEGGCDAAFGAWCARENSELTLVVMAELDGALHRAHATDADPLALVDAAWARLRSAEAVCA